MGLKRPMREFKFQEKEEFSLTKETYSKPVVEIEKFKTYDVIATSGIEGGDGGELDELSNDLFL